MTWRATARAASSVPSTSAGGGIFHASMVSGIHSGRERPSHDGRREIAGHGERRDPAERDPPALGHGEQQVADRCPRRLPPVVEAVSGVGERRVEVVPERGVGLAGADEEDLLVELLRRDRRPVGEVVAHGEVDDERLARERRLGLYRLGMRDMVDQPDVLLAGEHRSSWSRVRRCTTSTRRPASSRWSGPRNDCSFCSGRSGTQPIRRASMC